MGKMNHKLPEATTLVADSYSRRFFLTSVEASWKGESLKGEWDHSQIDWPYILFMGHHHRVLESFLSLWEGNVRAPVNIQNEIWIAQEMAANMGRLLESGITDLQEIARRHAIRLVLLKSPGYVEEGFGGFRFREVRDLDILASPDDVPCLTDELGKKGYNMHKLRVQRVFTKDSLRIEVHLKPIGRRRYWGLLPSSEMIARAEESRLHSPLLSLNCRDEALMLILHARHHEYRQALWLRDVAAWWRIRNPDPEEILQAFREIGLMRTAWIAWRGMEQFGWEMPDSWKPERWNINTTFDRRVIRYWEVTWKYTGETLRQFLLRMQLQLSEAEGFMAKIRTFLPMISANEIFGFFAAVKGSYAKGVINFTR